jgi:3-oxoacyl-[acyl-carrier protein] reductase
MVSDGLTVAGNAASLKNRTALITGSSRGIGAATAVLLAQSGVKVMLTGRDREALTRLQARIGETGGMAQYVVGDLADPGWPAELVRRTADRFGGLDILINNAGITLAKPVASTEPEEWDRVMAINVKAPFLITRAAIPFLRESSSGAIVNITSVVGYKGYPNQGAYTASKHALTGLTKVLAKELHEDGIRVFSVAPGGVATEMISRVRPDIDSDALIAPEEIARTVVFLLTQAGNAGIDEIRVRRQSKTPWD